MTLNSIIQYLKYKWNAMGRHGTHSPFVYEFIEQVLLDKGPMKKKPVIVCPDLSLNYENLLNRIAQYYGYNTILSLPSEVLVPKAGIDMLLISAEAPKQWIDLFDEYYPVLKSESIVVVAGIHKTAAHSNAWVKLCSDERVKMSLDVYGLGMLLFRETFKEQQHFILKY